MNGAVLLIGFNRPQLLRDRLLEISRLSQAGVDIYVSIDGPRQGNPEDELAQTEIRTILDEYSRNTQIQIWFSQANKGCDKHIFESISQVLSRKEYLVVIEDDVAITQLAILKMLHRAEETFAIGRLNPIIAMSGIFLKFAPVPNLWRLSNYFSAWGFAVNRNFWEIHIRTLAINDPKAVKELKSQSETWKKTTLRKQKIWEERIERTNYDYLIQRTIFLHGIHTIAPLFRISDNVGHGVSGAAHTRFRTPWFLKFSTFGRNDKISEKQISSQRIDSLLTWTDSQTWAGDGLLSVRGRNTGIRTFLRRLVTK
jgi:hypothetical protein